MTFVELIHIISLMNKNEGKDFKTIIQLMHTSDINTEGFSPNDIVELQTLFGIINGQISANFQQWWINFENSYNKWIKYLL